jgi:hypothetical protein
MSQAVLEKKKNCSRVKNDPAEHEENVSYFASLTQLSVDNGEHTRQALVADVSRDI